MAGCSAREAFSTLSLDWDWAVGMRSEGRGRGGVAAEFEALSTSSNELMNEEDAGL